MTKNYFRTNNLFFENDLSMNSFWWQCQRQVSLNMCQVLIMIPEGPAQNGMAMAP